MGRIRWAAVAFVGLLALVGCSGVQATTASESPPPGGAHFFQVRPVLSQTDSSASPDVAADASGSPSASDSASAVPDASASGSCPGGVPDPSSATVACNISGETRYELGPAYFTGQSVLSATPQLVGDQPMVIVTLDESAATEYLSRTQELNEQTAPRDQVAVLAGPHVLVAFRPEIGLFKGEIAVNFETREAAQEFAARVDSAKAS